MAPFALLAPSQRRRQLRLQQILFVISVAALHALYSTSASAAVANDSGVHWAIATGERALEPWESPSAASSDIDAAIQVCALDAVHIQVHWRLPIGALRTLAHAVVHEAQSKRLESDSNGLPIDIAASAATTLLSTVELLAVGTAHSASNAGVVATAAAKDHTFTSVFAANVLERLQRLVDQSYDDADTDTNSSDTLACEFDRAVCTPMLVGIRLLDLTAPDQQLAVNHSIALEFAQPTTRPHAATKQQIDRFIYFSAYVGDELAGEWSADGRVLTIRIVAVTDALLTPRDALMHALLQTSLLSHGAVESDAEAVDRLLAEYELDSEAASTAVIDNARFRIEPRGRFYVRLRVARKAEPANVLFAAESPLVRVASCGDDVAPTLVLQHSVATASLGPTEPGGQPTSALAAVPSFSLDGVLTLAGAEGFELPHAAIRMQVAGTWSLSFWVFVTSPTATGAFRSLVFNGDGADQHRTPSAWWMPDVNRLVLRASTSANVDAGGDSTQSIAMHRWVHLTFRFRNCSTVDGAADIVNGSSNADVTAMLSASAECADARAASPLWYYSIDLFVDGVKDANVRFFAPAIASRGPLHIGKDPWTDGMRGFVSNLHAFPVALSDAQVLSQYERERDAYATFAPVDNERLLATTVPVAQWSANPALQIAYLVQRRFAVASQRELVASQKAPSLSTLAAQTYEDAQRVLAQTCDSSGWDVLVEAAELGHAEALRDVGEAHLFGALALPPACDAAADVRVRQDFVSARKLLEAALQRGAWDASASLALLAVAADPIDAGDSVDGVPLASLTTGLYHLAAASGCRKDAFAVLARRYAAADTATDVGTATKTLDAAVFHYLHAALAAATAYHAHGQQPRHELDRLYDALERDVAEGQRGDDDALIAFQRLRAEQGDTDALAAMGDLHYWGARGVVRDHKQALTYFDRAARAGHVSAQAALAGMLLKGEGAAQDNASAIVWYERAAAANNTRALNGLGFVHFHGTGGVAVNRSHALALFERAAANTEDGDSVFNAGYCHANGLGARPNVTRAIEFYDVAARAFGHFDAILELGKLYTTGYDNGYDSVVPRDAARALPYLKAAAEGGGPWGVTVRRGFEWFLAGDWRRAAVRYHEAEELGYTVATSNLAFLYDQRLLQLAMPSSERNDDDNVDENTVGDPSVDDHRAANTVGDSVDDPSVDDPSDSETGSSDATDQLARERRALTYLVKTSRVNGDREVLVRVGDFHFYGLAGLHASARNALRWYTRASAAGVAAGAYSVGYMLEHGVGVQANLPRAQRYYMRVLELAPDARDVLVVVRLALARLAARQWLLAHAPASLTALLFEPLPLPAAADAAHDRSSSKSKQPFSELGGVALESVWPSGRRSVSALLLTLALVLLGVVYTRRS